MFECVGQRTAISVRRQRDRKAKRDTRKRRVHAGFQDRNPQDQPDDHIKIRTPDTQSVHDAKGRQTNRCDDQRWDRQAGCVEQRDDDDGGKVIDHGQRQQERLHDRRHLVAEQAENPQRKGDIGRSRDRPAADLCRVQTDDADKDQGRGDDAPDGTIYRQGRARPAG